jgi:hypothetical protein
MEIPNLAQLHIMISVNEIKIAITGYNLGGLGWSTGQS